MMDAIEPAATQTRAKVEIYGSMYCHYSIMAMRLLDDKAVTYSVHDVEEIPQLRTEMQARSGRTSVPQIFIDATHVGGYDELHALEENGQLDTLLGD